MGGFILAMRVSSPIGYRYSLVCHTLNSVWIFFFFFLNLAISLVSTVPCTACTLNISILHNLFSSKSGTQNYATKKGGLVYNVYNVLVLPSPSHENQHTYNGS